MPVPNLSSYGGSYTDLQYADTATLNFTGEDFAIIFTTAVLSQIKVKVDGSYLSEMVWYNGVNDGDIFDLSLDQTHSYYDSVDQSTSENPSVIRPNASLSFGEHELVIEVADITDNHFLLEAIFVYDESALNNVRDLTSEEIGVPLTVEQDQENRRNIVVVTGGRQGLFQSDGLTLNPNNPVTVRTYSKAVDLTSLYNAGADHYMGRRIPFEIYSERIHGQERADHVSLNALKKYWLPAFQPDFSLTYDPRLMEYDPLGFTEKKLNTMRNDRVWIDSISEVFKDNKWETDISTSAREPMESFVRKPEPNYALYDNEPIINIQLKSQGKRISGGDATESGGVVTIATDPEWEHNMWDGYYLSDNNGTAFEITANSFTTLTVDLVGQPYSAGNWSISFDPFDTDQKGAPLEIHYDQVINAKVQIWIKDAEDNAIARVNKDEFNAIAEWGENKVQYWSGAAEYNTKENKSGCYVSRHSADYTKPLSIHFMVIPEDTNYDIVEIATCSGDLRNTGTIQMVGEDVSHSPLGACRIYPRLLKHLPLVKVRVDGERNYATNNIQYIGYVASQADNGDNKDLRLAPNAAFSTNQYQDYLLINTRNQRMYYIDSNTSNTVTIIDKEKWDSNSGAANNVVIIIGQGGVGRANYIHDVFRSTDNDGQGGKIVLEQYDFTYQRQLSSNPVSGKLGPYVGADDSGAGGINFNIGDNGFVVGHYDGEEHQHYPDRGIYASGAFSALYQTWKSFLPNGNILSNPDFRISADLAVYRGNSIARVEKVAEENDYISTDGFVRIDEFEHYLQPLELIFNDNDGSEIFPSWGTNSGWYFLFKFRFMDRAGRFVLNEFYWVDSDNPDESYDGNLNTLYGNQNELFYLIGWDDPSRTPYSHYPFHLVDDQDDFIRANITKAVTRYS